MDGASVTNDGFGRLTGSAWPAFAPRLGLGLRNVRTSGLNLGNIGRNFAVPVGFGGIAPSIVESARIPQLVTTAPQPPQTTLPTAIDRRDIPPIQATGVRVARDWIEYWELKEQGIPVQGPNNPRINPPIVGAPPLPTSNSMDLGTGLIGLASDFITAKYGGPQQLAAPVFTPQVMAGAGAAVAAAAGVGSALMDVIPQRPDSGCGGRPVYKYHCGEYKWVYPKRRRRKALATQSDLRGLAALKGVLGQGKAFEVWIATHS